MKAMDEFVKLFEKTKMKIERLQGIVSEVDLWEREGKTKGLEEHVQFIKKNSKNLNRYDEVRREYDKLLGLIGR